MQREITATVTGGIQAEKVGNFIFVASWQGVNTSNMGSCLPRDAGIRGGVGTLRQRMIMMSTKRRILLALAVGCLITAWGIAAQKVLVAGAGSTKLTLIATNPPSAMTATNGLLKPSKPAGGRPARPTGLRVFAN